MAKIKIGKAAGTAFNIASFIVAIAPAVKAAVAAVKQRKEAR